MTFSFYREEKWIIQEFVKKRIEEKFAITLPFYILTSFIMKQDMNEQEEGKIRGE